jgi:pyruvate-formate lyase-activating enzyme
VASKTLGFAVHGRDLGTNRYVYAVVSRRARGLSVGVNMNPDKVCNFDCPYCQVDRTIPGGSPVVDVEVLEAELSALLAAASTGTLFEQAPFDTVPPALQRVADIAFAGDGEPTSPREFPEAARLARDARDRHDLDVPLRLLTNATLLDRDRVWEALPHFDELWCKLDAGTDRHFHFAGGTSMPFSRVLTNLVRVARVRPITVQSLFFAYDGAGLGGDEIDAWILRLREILTEGGQIQCVQVYTVARRPTDPKVEPLPEQQLQAIAERVRELGLAAEVHGPAGPEGS